MEQITLQELQKHNTMDDLWISISGVVYDVTKYQDEHPGSDSILQDVGGIDSTQEFLDVGHSKEAYEIMKNLEIGHLDSNNSMITNNNSMTNHISNHLHYQTIINIMIISSIIICMFIIYNIGRIIPLVTKDIPLVIKDEL